MHIRSLNEIPWQNEDVSTDLALIFKCFYCLVDFHRRDMYVGLELTSKTHILISI